jgi:hypothetical protein
MRAAKNACPPCNLTKEEVKNFDERIGFERVALIGGKCQNLVADGSGRICGQPLTLLHKVIT